MMTSRKKSESGLSPKGQRYWSLMLVGEHGRVIPVRRFKEMAIAIFAIALLSIAALAILGFFYVQQGRTIEKLRTELSDLKAYTDRLKDEKDVLNARLGIKKAQMEPKSETPVHNEEEKVAGPTAEESVASEEKELPAETMAAAKEVRTTEPAKPKPAVVRWDAEIREPSVDYDPRRSILKAKFRVYNRSVPKNKLAGRTVVVFKNKADPPIKWFAVPNVLLSNGQPDGKVGQAFNINNFITMRHHAYGIKNPERYDAAVVFVFTANGKLLASRETDFKIETPPPPKPAPVKTPVVEAPKTPVPAPATPSDKASPKATEQQGASEKPSEAKDVRGEKPAETDMVEPSGESAVEPPDNNKSTGVGTEGDGGGQAVGSETLAPVPEKKTPLP
jgi:hypothetical protein